MLFELGFGHWVAGHPWSRLLADYDLLAGRIWVLVLTQFRRHRKALVVMLTMPLSLLGAVVGLQLTGYPFGFTSFLGVIGLMSVVVRNGIILVGYAEELQASQSRAAFRTARGSTLAR